MILVLPAQDFSNVVESIENPKYIVVEFYGIKKITVNILLIMSHLF